MSKSKSSRSSGSGKSSSRGVSASRLHQKSGASNSFGGYTKVQNSNGSFRMRPSGK
ncbi:hypothetical protein [Schaalia sp. JY-X159]|uniref:hypothetical protein n=1 Tax=Schaalia sp. JY-X159 TaxID=2758575 RepID=UPI00165E26F7|nr:hypothetical protein [Schaalia sp. JY-X159]